MAYLYGLEMTAAQGGVWDVRLLKREMGAVVLNEAADEEETAWEDGDGDSYERVTVRMHNDILLMRHAPAMWAILGALASADADSDDRHYAWEEARELVAAILNQASRGLTNDD